MAESLWTGKIFWRGYHHTLDEADVYDVLPQDSTVKLSDNLAREWEKELYKYKTGGRPSLTRALWRCYRRQILAFTFLIFLEECLRMVQAYLMGEFIGLFEGLGDDETIQASGADSAVISLSVVQNVSSEATSSTSFSKSISRPDVYILIPLIAFTYLISVFLDHNFFHHGYRMRVATTSLIYRKVMRLRSASLNSPTMETIMNLVTKDMDVFPLVVLPATYILIGPVQLGVTCYMMWEWLDLGPACVISLVLLILLFPMQIFMGKLYRALREKMDSLSSTRLRIVQLVMSGLEEMKTSNLTQFCCRVVARARRCELHHMAKLGRLQALNSSLTLTSGKVVVMATFLVLVVTGREISARQVFTALILEESLRVSLSLLLPAGMLALADTLATLRKVEEVLLLPERASTLVRPPNISLTEEVSIRFNSYFASKQKNFDAPMVLVNIDLEVQKVSKAMAVLDVFLLGKSLTLREKCNWVDKTFVSFRQFGFNFAMKKKNKAPYENDMKEILIAHYENLNVPQVVDALALRDQTVVGERGLSLDHSIQVKVTLARAVYQNCNIYLIDDILRGMDTKSAMHIFKRCICGLLRSKTRLVITDNTHHTQVAHKVILMSQCRVVHVDSYNDLLANGINVNQILTSGSYRDPYEPDPSPSLLEQSSSPIIKDLAMTNLAFSGPSHTLTSSVKDSPAGSAFDILQADFKRSGPSTQRSVYTSYFLLGGGMCGILFFALTCLLEQVIHFEVISRKFYLFRQSENQQNTSSKTYRQDVPVLGQAATELDFEIYVYIGLVSGAVLLGGLQAALFYVLARRAGTVLHDKAVSALFGSPLGFFQANGRASILSHFARDIGIVDSLPPVLLDSVQSFSVLIATVILVSCINYWLFFLTVPLSLMFLWARGRFHKATKGVERIEIASKSAVGAHVVSSMEGIQTLRSLAVEQRFLHKFDVYQDRSTAACYLHLAANRWFGIRVDLMGLVVVVGVLVGAFLVVEYQGLDLPASLVGLSLYYALNLINISQPALRKSAAVHFKMNSVLHLFQYSQLVPEIPRLPDTPDTQTSPGWPRYGIVTCEGVSVPSIGGGPAKGGNLLKNIWCCIRAQEKMGIIFSTESERRAFLSMLYRLTPYGGMVRLDGVDITSLPKDRLREKMAYISHSPTLLLGSVRESIDPDKTYTDAQIWKALEQVHLSTIVSALPMKLATDMVTVAEAMTTGQRQLLRLAAALLHQTRVLIYEEPSSSLDVICSTIIQGVLRTQFPSSTVIHIAHLPNTIIHMDRIMIFHEGRIAEVDTPHYLLQNISSRLSAMVAELGSAQSEHLRQLALDKHENRPYVAPLMDPADLQELTSSTEIRPGRLNVLPTFHSSRLAGVLNQLPTNKFSTDRL
ncbi:hypothetical protein EGW08_003054 [Elysia chlorotica]|uniref:ABC transmembrane type-1 domain-containing protein n=1 Tax=Elysia chlorotica TaxID=188477 RepID=A0A433U5R6_ELYCH|nr:hypothetical protein EGW08_003054 [Elysia chlorotica]